MTTIEFETVRMNGLVTLLHHIENGRVDRGIDEFGGGNERVAVGY